MLALEPFVDGVESRPVDEQIVIAALGLLATTVVLGASEIIASTRRSARHVRRRFRRVGLVKGARYRLRAGIRGAARTLALGTTIATGQALGMSRGEAARFSFLMSIPIISAATAKKLLDLTQGQGSSAAARCHDRRASS